MNIRTSGRRVSVLSALVVGSIALGSCAEQPEVQCFAALSIYTPFTVAYSLVEGTGECAELKADGVGIQTYVTNPDKKSDGKNSIALQTLQMGNWRLKGRSYRVTDAEGAVVETPTLDEDPEHKLYALGKFTSKHPNDDDICSVPTLSPAELTLPELDAHPAYFDDEFPTLFHDEEEENADEIPAQPALEARLEWSNVKVYVTAGDTGTQFGADLKYTVNGCSATYRAIGVNVYAECETDEDCAGASSESYAELKCVESSEPNPADLSTFKKLCALTGDFPQLR